jgi:O-acetyl-ADP-ribose deacetylase (regulator of RNase III)
MLKYLNNNLFLTDCAVIAHGCNVCGAFGAGVAGQIARLFPEARSAYFLAYNNKTINLGNAQIVKVKNPKTNTLYIANLFTQPSYGKVGQHVSYEACYSAFNQLFDFCEDNELSVAMPKIGVGLGGGLWNEIEKQLVKSLNSRTILVKVYTYVKDQTFSSTEL